MVPILYVFFFLKNVSEHIFFKKVSNNTKNWKGQTHRRDGNIEGWHIIRSIGHNWSAWLTNGDNDNGRVSSVVTPKSGVDITLMSEL